MSRVEDARRRAAELVGREAAEGSPRAEPLRPLPVSDADTFANETFPPEMPGLGSHAGRIPSSRFVAQSRPVASRVGPDTLADDGTPGAPSEWLESLDDTLSHKIVGALHMTPASREQYRRLAATLYNVRVASGVKVIMVASAVSGEGKTLTAANLALTFSESYHRRVLLVDADLRRPMIHELFLHNSTVPSDHLAPLDQQPLPFTQVTPRLAVLTIGLPSSAPMAELTSERMERLLQEARKAFDWIVIDTPPVALLPDASLLASRVDGAILVVKAESTSLELVEQAVEAIGRKKMLGFVLNAARTQPSAKYRYDESPLTPLAGSRNSS